MENLKTLVHSSLILQFGLAVLIGCSPVEFSKQKEKTTCNGFDTCVVEPTNEFHHFIETKQVDNPTLDILVVNDTSSSMTQEQALMGSRFSSFLNQISGFDWQLGITTMDIYDNAYFDASRTDAYNDFKAPKKISNNHYDGNLLPFSNGKSILKSTDADRNNLFAKRIQTPSTEFGSGDERGIYAASLALLKQNKAGGLIRHDSHIAVIFLSDENVRGGRVNDCVGAKNNPTCLRKDAREKDMPEHFLQQIETLNLNSNTGRSLSVHSLIIPPSDSTCLNEQVSSTGNGSYGTLYAQLSNNTSTKGIIDSICEDDYGSALANIGSYVKNRVLTEVALTGNCDPILDDSLRPFKVLLNDQLLTMNVDYSLQGRRVVFNYAIESGDVVKTDFYCKKK